MNKSVYIFPCILIALDIAAAIVYGISGDWKKGGILARRCSSKCNSDVLRGEENERQII